MQILFIKKKYSKKRFTMNLAQMQLIAFQQVSINYYMGPVQCIKYNISTLTALINLLALNLTH